MTVKEFFAVHDGNEINVTLREMSDNTMWETTSYYLKLDDDLHNEWKNANVLFWEIDDENNMYLDVEKRSADL